MNFIRFPSELHLLIVEKLESRELSYLSRTNHYFHSLCTPALERLAQQPRKRHCALGWAIIKNYPQLVQFLLSKGHDINHLGRDVYVATALHKAISCRNYPLTLLFLDNPALDLNKLDFYGNTALHIAIEWRNLEVVKLLHAAGADLEIANRRKRTALLLALQYGHMGIMGYLIRNGADVNVRSPAWADSYETFLQGLVWVGSERLVRLAIEHGADPEVRDYWHQRPIDIAFRWGFTGMVDILREVSPLDMNVECVLGMLSS
ncbi:ankyrin repeat-containing domain protein [Tuber borchii]|uniref:Ankyrin repeat-containing domain protein n=1 Tax=Tuber borchii TaxID=42251 RepID=A0A2T7A2H9_TUBBO|nr:ankyrin repeat-containing domain protein [Tuber borchii]